jgi:hypothetical protein
MSVDVDASGAAQLRQAIEVVGWNPPGNYSFHASAFEARHIAPLRCLLPDSQPLVDILETNSITMAVSGYAKADAEALTEQRRFQRDSRAIAWPLWFSVLFGMAVILVPPGVLADAMSRVLGSGTEVRDKIILTWREFGPWLVYGGLIVTAVLSFALRPAAHYRQWQQQRAKAEALRREVFKRLLDHPATPKSGSDPWDLLLRLEYFRRWQVELQRDYFKKRGAEHARTVRLTSWLNGAAVVIFILLAFVLLSSVVGDYDEQGMPSKLIRGPVLGMTSILGFATGLNWDYWLLSFGALAVTTFAYYFLLGSLTAAKRNTPRFECMRENFDELLGERLKLARAGAARGEERSVRDYADRVHSVMALEINDWVRLADLDLGLDNALRQSPGEPHPFAPANSTVPEATASSG